MAHVHLSYSSDRKTVKAEIIAEHRDKVGLTYSFDNEKQNSNTKMFSSSDKGPVAVAVMGADGSKIELDPIDFLWDAPSVTPKNPSGDYRDGQKGAIIEMFMWPHTDIAKECEMLSKLGYLGVKLFPAQEQVMSFQPFENALNPWYFCYQPVSYRLHGRMGTRDDLREAIQTCRRFGVRVYADAAINHMSGGGNDANTKHRNPNAGCATWGAKTSSLEVNNINTAISDGPSPYYTQNFVYTEGSYTGKPPSQEFPAAHLGPTDFHCERSLNSWTDPLILNAGWLTGLTDLNTEKESVQDRIADYLTDLVSIGFSGIRIDAAKHIHPDSLTQIFTKLRDNLGGKLPDDFVSWLEVILGGEADLLMCNPSSGYNFGLYLENKLKSAGWDQTDVDKIKIWNSGYPKEPEKGYGCGTISPKRNVIQNDDHDQQNPGSSSRDMAEHGCVLIKGCQVNDHRNFEIKLFESPRGATNNNDDYPIRLILSSYYWEDNSIGVPDGLSDCSKCTTTCDSCKSVQYKPAYVATSCGYDSGSGVYTRVHRDMSIVNAMRKWMNLPSISYADVGLHC